MTEDYMVSLREASTILNKKPSTVRAYVRAGRLSKQYVEGFNGQEMRLSRKEVQDLAPLIKTDESLIEIENKQDTKKESRSAKKTVKSAGERDVLTELLDERLPKNQAKRGKDKSNADGRQTNTDSLAAEAEAPIAAPASTGVVSQATTDSTVSRALELLEAQISELRKEKEELRQESKSLGEKNFQMAGQLGYFQNQVETLKDQVKQLTVPSKSENGRDPTKKVVKRRWFSFLSSR